MHLDHSLFAIHLCYHYLNLINHLINHYHHYLYYFDYCLNFHLLIKKHIFNIYRFIDFNHSIFMYIIDSNLVMMMSTIFFYFLFHSKIIHRCLIIHFQFYFMRFPILYIILYYYLIINYY